MLEDHRCSVSSHRIRAAYIFSHLLIVFGCVIVFLSFDYLGKVKKVQRRINVYNEAVVAFSNGGVQNILWNAHAKGV